MENTQVATKESNLPSTEFAGDWDLDTDSGVRSENLVIPKILLVQKQCKLFDNEDFQGKQGDLVDSVSQEVLAKNKTGLDVIPLTVFETWETYDKTNGSKWIGSEPLTLANANLDREWTEKTGEIEMKFARQQTLNFFVLLKKDIAKVLDPKDPYTEADLFPYKISFASTSKRAGKIIATQFSLAKTLRQPAARFTFKIGMEPRSNGENNWYAFTAVKNGTNSDAELAACLAWYKTMKAGGEGIQVDNSDLGNEAGEAPTADGVDTIPF